MLSRIHSSEIKPSMGSETLRGVTSFDFSIDREYESIRTLHSTKVNYRVQSKPIECETSITWIFGSGSSDPFFDFEKDGIISIEKLPILKLKNQLGVYEFDHQFLTSYSVSCSVGELIEGSCSFIGQKPKLKQEIIEETEYKSYLPSLASKIFVNGVGPDVEMLNNFPIQSLDFEFSIEREPIKELGQLSYEKYRPVLPAVGSLQVSFLRTQNFENHILKPQPTLVPSESYAFLFDHLNNQVFDHLDQAVEVDESFANSIFEQTPVVLPNNELTIKIGGCNGEHFEYKISDLNLISINETSSLDDNTVYEASYEFSIGSPSDQGFEFSREKSFVDAFQPTEGYIFVFDHLNNQVFDHLDQAVEVDESFANSN